MRSYKPQGREGRGPTYKGRGRGDERMDRKEVEENSPKVKVSRINTRYIDT